MKNMNAISANKGKLYWYRNYDPVLEKLRSEVDGPPNLDTLALSTRRLTSNIHAAYLFEKEGTSTLRQLCLLLSATAMGKLYSGWQDFGAHLGLSLEQLQVSESTRIFTVNFNQFKKKSIYSV